MEDLARVGHTSARTAIRPICCGVIDRGLERHESPQRSRRAVRAVRTVGIRVIPAKMCEVWNRRSAKIHGKCGLSPIRHAEWGSGAPTGPQGLLSPANTQVSNLRHRFPRIWHASGSGWRMPEQEEEAWFRLAFILGLQGDLPSRCPLSASVKYRYYPPRNLSSQR